MQVAGLQHRLVELESTEQKSRELLQESEASRQQSEQRLRETSDRLEEALEEGKVQMRELSAKVSLAENKTQSLEEKLSLGDAKCKELVLKLAGLYSVLRCTVGISRMCFSDTPGLRRRSPSPWRMHLQGKGMVTDF